MFQFDEGHNKLIVGADTTEEDIVKFVEKYQLPFVAEWTYKVRFPSAPCSQLPSHAPSSPWCQNGHIRYDSPSAPCSLLPPMLPAPSYAPSPAT